METITYKQAADLLEMKYATIKNAVLYGKLTRCAVSTGDTMLLREQVELFKNKRRISVRSLNIREKELWGEYKRIAENSELLALATKDANENQTASLLIAKEIAKLGHEEYKNRVNHALEEIRKQLDNIQETYTNPSMPLVLK